MFAQLITLLIQCWIRITGTTYTRTQAPWLFGPHEKGNIIGDDFFERYASLNGLEVQRNAQDSGLIPDFKILDSLTFDASKCHPLVAAFYEKTASYKMEIWSQWYSWFSFVARIFIKIVGKEIQQLNIPLQSIETSRGMSSEVIRLVDTNDKQVYACWFRKLVYTKKIVYAGFYTTTKVPGHDGECVKVVFPLPKGNVIVILRPETYPDGSFALVSDGKKPGGPGYYRTHYINEDKIKVKRIPLHEKIHLFVDEEGVLRTDHSFHFWGIRFLLLHYKIMERRG